MTSFLGGGSGLGRQLLFEKLSGREDLGTSGASSFESGEGFLLDLYPTSLA